MRTPKSGIPGIIHFTNQEMAIYRDPITGETFTPDGRPTGFFITDAGKVVTPNRGKMIPAKATFSGEI